MCHFMVLFTKGDTVINFSLQMFCILSAKTDRYNVMRFNAFFATTDCACIVISVFHIFSPMIDG